MNRLNKANIATDYCSYKRTAVEKSISRFISNNLNAL